MSRGRRAELIGWGSVVGASLATAGLPWAGIVYGLAFVVVGVWLQWRADGRRKFPPNPVVITKDGVELEGKEREVALWEQCGLLAWEIAGRPGLPSEPAEVMEKVGEGE